MKIRILTFLSALCLTLGLFINNAYAAEYNGGSWTGYTSASWPQDNRVTFHCYYTPSTTSIGVNIVKERPSCFYGYYKFNGGNQVDIYDTDFYNNVFLNTFSNLQPDTAYSLYLNIYTIAHEVPNGSLWCSVLPASSRDWYITLYTEPVIPNSFTFPTISPNQIKLMWSNGNNPADTSYTVQRRPEGSEIWSDMHTAQNLTEYTDTGLAQNYKYNYRIRVNSKRGTEFYSNEVYAVTAVDPTIAATQAAKSAAETASASADMAKIAADNAAAGAASALAAANSAATNALNAYTDANYIRNSMLSIDGAIVQDANGTVLEEARQAKTSAQTANTKLDSMQNTITDMQNSLANMQNSITNIQNNMGVDTSPPVVELSTLSGARATSGNSIKLIVNLLDNQPGPFTYSIDGVLYNPLPLDYCVTVPILNPGNNLITVMVRDVAGNVGFKTITIRKI